MRSTWIVAMTTVRGIFRPKNLLWLILLVGLVVPTLFIGPLQIRKAALAAGETEAANSILAGAATQGFSLATQAFMIVGLLLGLTAMSTEAKQRTIVTVLARPVERWQFVAGKWLGLCLMLWGLSAIVLAAAVAALAYTGVWPSPMFWMRAADSFVNATLVTGIAVALGTVFSPMGGFAIVLLLPMATGLAQTGNQTLAWLGEAIGYLLPADMPANLISDGLATYTFEPAYGLYAAVMAQNVLYACSLIGLAMIVFDRRDVRLAAE